MAELKIGTKVKDRYTLKEFKGSGSFGEVWLATDNFTALDVAIKVYITLDNRGIEEFRREYVITSEMNHPNLLVPKYFDIWERRPFLVMEYCGAGSAGDKVGKLTEKEIFKFIEDVSAGLTYLHNLPSPIIHQDIKPDNILIDDNGDFRITDFGISKTMRSTMRKHTNTGVSMGAIAYMAPEKFDGNPMLIKASDIWALGVSIYELATGELPFYGMGGNMQRNGAELPVLSQKWSRKLNSIMQSCLAKDPWDRPTAKKLHNMIDEPFQENRDNNSVDVGKLNNTQNRDLNATQICSGMNIDDKHKDLIATESTTTNESTPPKRNHWVYFFIIVCIICGGCLYLFNRPTIEYVPQSQQDLAANNPEKSIIADEEPETQPSEELELQVKSTPQNTKSDSSNDQITHQTKIEENTTENSSVYVSSRNVSATTTGSLNIGGYAEYYGEMSNGKPEGKGRLTFTTSHTDGLRGYNAEAGDYIDGYFMNGNLEQGKLFSKDGNLKKSIY